MPFALNYYHWAFKNLVSRLHVQYQNLYLKIWFHDLLELFSKYEMIKENNIQFFCKKPISTLEFQKNI